MRLASSPTVMASGMVTSRLSLGACCWLRPIFLSRRRRMAASDGPGRDRFRWWRSKRSGGCGQRRLRRRGGSDARAWRGRAARRASSSASVGGRPAGGAGAGAAAIGLGRRRRHVGNGRGTTGTREAPGRAPADGTQPGRRSVDGPPGRRSVDRDRRDGDRRTGPPGRRSAPGAAGRRASKPPGRGGAARTLFGAAAAPDARLRWSRLRRRPSQRRARHRRGRRPRGFRGGAHLPRCGGHRPRGRGDHPRPGGRRPRAARGRGLGLGARQAGVARNAGADRRTLRRTAGHRGSTSDCGRCGAPTAHWAWTQDARALLGIAVRAPRGCAFRRPPCCGRRGTCPGARQLKARPSGSGSSCGRRPGSCRRYQP